MRSSLIIDFFLGFALQFFRDQEDEEAIIYVQQALALKRSGGNINAHLQLVADYLIDGERPDFRDLVARITSEVDELLARGGPAE